LRSILILSSHIRLKPFLYCFKTNVNDVYLHDY
jgi:hypothetical protein